MIQSQGSHSSFSGLQSICRENKQPVMGTYDKKFGKEKIKCCHSPLCLLWGHLVLDVSQKKALPESLIFKYSSLSSLIVKFNTHAERCTNINILLTNNPKVNPGVTTTLNRGRLATLPGARPLSLSHPTPRSNHHPLFLNNHYFAFLVVLPPTCALLKNQG